jgi:hypothetical protein
MEIFLGSITAVTCLFYVYAFMKFAGERATREGANSRLPAVTLPLSGCSR